MIYLAGAIFMSDDETANGWRTVVKAELGEENCLDPMRRDYRGKEDESVQEIIDGDIADILASDAVLANCVKPSWGTAMEVFFAASEDIPVLAITGGGRVSPWLQGHSAACVATLDEALRLVKTWL